MRTHTQTILALSTLLLAFGSAPQALAQDEAKTARKNLKKNVKRLAKLQKVLAVEDKTCREGENSQARDAAEARVVAICAKSVPLLEAIGLADNAKAAEALANFGTFVPSQETYAVIVDRLQSLESEDAIAWMCDTLQGSLVSSDEPGKRKRRKRKKKKKKKKRGGATWKVQVLLADVFEGVQDELLIPPLAAQLEQGTQAAVVNACLMACKRKRDPRIVTGLIALLGRVEKAGGWEYYEVRQRLVEFTGEDFLTHERWKEWWSTRREGWDPEVRGKQTEAKTRQRKPGEKVPTFFGSEIQSNRALFVIDISGSMKMTDKPVSFDLSKDDFWRANPDTPELKKFQRIERAREQLIGAISNMVPTQHFNVMSFSDATRYFDKALVPATDANKQRAIRWCQGLSEGGGTSTDRALGSAFADESIDTIYLLSDGAPMKMLMATDEARKEHSEGIIRKCLYMVREANRFRRVKIYTFGMDGPGVWHRKWGNRPEGCPEEPKYLAPLQEFMRKLAEITGGSYKSI